jgi:predicted 2-oxoglutarate/Fe(II)-dependent dioxygenase YbiX
VATSAGPALGLKGFRDARLYVVEDFLPSELRATLAEEMHGAIRISEASVYFDGERKARPEQRKTAMVQIGPELETRITELFKQQAAPLAAHFGMTLRSFEPPQYLRYGPGHFFGAHTDSSDHELFGRRKVSMVVFVNEPGADYEGGDLLLYGLLSGEAFKKVGLPFRPRAGLLLAFPSNTLHEVKPVIAGERLSIVSWFLDSPKG